jgi:hypothetical protein
LNIEKKELYNNIKEVYPQVKKSSFKLKEIEIDPLFTELYGAWIGEGDHSSKREAISLTNYSVELLKLHIKLLIKFGFGRNKIKAEIISPKKEPKNKIKEKWSKILNLPLNQITTVTYMENATQEGAGVEVWCAGLFRILHQIDNKIKSIIKNSNKNIKIAYIKGIFAAEGSVRKKGKEIRINMKDISELIFVEYILQDLNIKSRPIKFNKFSRCCELSILGFKNIKQFKEINGFGLNKKRNNLLNKVFETYERNLPYPIRFEQIKKILLKKQEISNNELAKIFNKHPKHIAWITKHFADAGMLEVDKSSKVYKYSLVDS